MKKEYFTLVVSILSMPNLLIMSQASAAETIVSPRIQGIRVSTCVVGSGCNSVARQEAADAFCIQIGYQSAVGFRGKRSGITKKAKKDVMRFAGFVTGASGTEPVWTRLNNRRRWFKSITCK